MEATVRVIQYNCINNVCDEPIVPEKFEVLLGHIGERVARHNVIQHSRIGFCDSFSQSLLQNRVTSMAYELQQISRKYSRAPQIAHEGSEAYSSANVLDSGIRGELANDVERSEVDLRLVGARVALLAPRRELELEARSVLLGSRASHT